MAGDGFQRAEQALMLWLDEGNCESDTKNMAHKINFDYSLKLLTNILENDNVNTRRPNKSELWVHNFWTQVT
jgi:hypothetical protein